MNNIAIVSVTRSPSQTPRSRSHIPSQAACPSTTVTPIVVCGAVASRTPLCCDARSPVPAWTAASPVSATSSVRYGLGITSPEPSRTQSNVLYSSCKPLLAHDDLSDDDTPRPTYSASSSPSHCAWSDFQRSYSRLNPETTPVPGTAESATACDFKKREEYVHSPVFPPVAPRVDRELQPDMVSLSSALFVAAMWFLQAYFL